MRRRVLLFDIDGTLIHCGGAGGKSLWAALQDEFQLTDVRPVSLHGRTDLGVFNELLAGHGLDPSEENRQRLSRNYYARLPDSLRQLALNRAAHVLPGVQELLTRLATQAQSVVALLTGNMPDSAKIKLEHFGLWSHFRFGVFGDLADHRPKLAAPAWAQIRQQMQCAIAGSDVVIIGDTPLDVELAQAMGAKCLAVCTGGFSRDQLLAAGADSVLPDLTDTNAVADWLHYS